MPHAILSVTSKLFLVLASSFFFDVKLSGGQPALVDDNRNEPLPPADRFVSQQPASWDDLKALRPPTAGKCWVQITFCPLNPSYSGIGDEFDEAYAELGVGESEQACLARAKYHWEICGSNPFHQVLMSFLPSGATASFPDDATVERQYSSKHAFYRLAKWVGTDKAHCPATTVAPMPERRCRIPPAN
jgi:hypothetical protein